ncbi:MAG: L,D-transpeptidase family protein [Acidimicrobiia bacterium]|nr:L,D-transpeptidase family protein [Acidimicrobiia bacterium]
MATLWLRSRRSCPSPGGWPAQPVPAPSAQRPAPSAQRPGIGSASLGARRVWGKARRGTVGTGAALAALSLAACGSGSGPTGPEELVAPSSTTTAAAPSTTRPTTTAAPTTAPPSTPVPTTVPPVTTTTEPPLGPGASGPVVADLQSRLAALGYSIGAADGGYGGRTSSAVMAFQKVEGLSADGVPGPETLARLSAPQGSVPSGGGLRIEIDLARQVLFVVSGAGTTIFNTSTGNNEPFEWPDGTPGLAYTPTGEFAVYHRVEGVDDGALGAMYRPLYFHTDWAVHGSGYVPAYPASHGCARVSNADQDWIWENVPNGTPVVVY